MNEHWLWRMAGLPNRNLGLQIQTEATFRDGHGLSSCPLCTSFNNTPPPPPSPPHLLSALAHVCPFPVITKKCIIVKGLLSMVVAYCLAVDKVDKGNTAFICHDHIYIYKLKEMPLKSFNELAVLCSKHLIYH